MTLEGADKAIEAYETGMGCINNFERYYVPELIMSLAGTYVSVDRTSDALSLLERYASQFNTAKYVYAYANTLWAANQILQALGNYIKVIMMKDAETLGGELSSCYGRIIQIYEAFGEKEMAENFHQKFLTYYADKESVVNRE